MIAIRLFGVGAVVYESRNYYARVEIILFGDTLGKFGYGKIFKNWKRNIFERFLGGF